MFNNCCSDIPETCPLGGEFGHNVFYKVMWNILSSKLFYLYTGSQPTTGMI